MTPLSAALVTLIGTAAAAFTVVLALRGERAAEQPADQPAVPWHHRDDWRSALTDDDQRWVERQLAELHRTEDA